MAMLLQLVCWATFYSLSDVDCDPKRNWILQYKDYFNLYFAFTLLKMVVNLSGHDTTDVSALVDSHRHTVKHTICHVIIIPFQDAFSKPYF